MFRLPNVLKLGCHSWSFWSFSLRWDALSKNHIAITLCCFELWNIKLQIIWFWWSLQYLAHLIRPGKNIFDRFAVLFTVAIVWIYAHLLTVGGAYNGTPPKTQASCRTDRAGLIDGAPWWVLFLFLTPHPFLLHLAPGQTSGNSVGFPFVGPKVGLKWTFFFWWSWTLKW